jgi:hypothetical protein
MQVSEADTAKFFVKYFFQPCLQNADGNLSSAKCKDIECFNALCYSPFLGFIGVYHFVDVTRMFLLVEIITC